MRDEVEGCENAIGCMSVCIFLAAIWVVGSILWDSTQGLREKLAALDKEQKIVISYDIQFDSVYTGAVTYIPYRGSKMFQIGGRSVAYSGLPVMHWIDQCVILDFERANGEACRLFFKTLGKHDNQQGFIPAATDGVIRFQKNLNQILFVSVRVERRGENNFSVFVTPLGAESMTGKI